MNATDLIVLILGSYFIVRGLFKGISGELLSLASVIGGFYCSLAFYAPVAYIISERFKITPLITTTLTMLTIFCLIYSGCAIINRSIKKILKETNLTWVDKLMGAIAGFLKIYLITLMLLVIGMLISPITGDTWIKESKSLVVAARTWPVVYPLLDKMGVLPDIESLQKEAAAYILRQASESLTSTPLEDSGSINYRDLSEDIDYKSADQTTLQNSMIDSLLGWGWGKKTTDADISNR